MKDDGHLRILHVSEVHWGGVVSLLDQFLEQQRDAGHEVHLLAPEGPGTWNGPDFHRWDLDRSRPLSLVTAMRQLRRTVRDLKPDVIHLHSFYAGFLGRLPLGLSWRGRVPVVYQPHAWSTSLYQDRRPLLEWIVGALERRGTARTDLLVANCQDEVDHGVEIGVRARARVLGVAVDLDRFRPDASCDEGARLKELAGVDFEDKLLLVLGRIGHQKGQDLLLPEWERATPSGALLALVGPGEPQSVAHLAPSQWDRSVMYFPASGDVRGWLTAADLLVLPSRYEGFAIVMAEAMAMGLPVVATAVNGAREALEEGVGHPAGAVVPLGDMPALMKEIDRRLSDPQLLDDEGRAARVRAEAMFRPAEVFERLDAAYRDVIHRVAREGVSA